MLSYIHKQLNIFFCIKKWYIFKLTVFFLNFFACAADALLADFADVLVARFVGFACFIALFGKLHHDKLAVSPVLSIELHHSVSSGGRAGEEIEDDRII